MIIPLIDGDMLSASLGPAVSKSNAPGLKALVRGSVTSPHSKRAYAQSLAAFERWCAQTGRLRIQPRDRTAYRASMEQSGLAASSINVAISAIRKLATEAAEAGWLAQDAAAGVARVKGSRRRGVRAGNWLTLPQARQLLHLPDPATNKGLRDRALLALLLGCGLRREELARLTSANAAASVAKASAPNRSTTSSMPMGENSGRPSPLTTSAEPSPNWPTKAGPQSSKFKFRSAMRQSKLPSAIWVSTKTSSTRRATTWGSCFLLH